MEVFAVFTGKLSLFNDDLNPDGDPTRDVVTLSVVFDPIKDIIDAQRDEFILYEARLGGIISIIPYKVITILESNGIQYRTPLYRVILDDFKHGFLVQKQTEANGTQRFKGKIDISPADLNDYEALEVFIRQENWRIDEINCSSSRFQCPPPTGMA